MAAHFVLAGIYRLSLLRLQALMHRMGNRKFGQTNRHSHLKEKQVGHAVANTFARLGRSLFRRIPPIRKAMTIPLLIVTTKHLQIDIFHQFIKLFDNLFVNSKKQLHLPIPTHHY